ncbi:MAG: DUF2252 domain-containing protein, partial [Candidatus Electrothrix sp. AR3]|nr:DUF2252 domain-containing protein [Candidatus Electrothrix sp. AR3]
MRKNFIIAELKAYNKGIKKNIRYDKYCKMAVTAYAFYRGTDHLYWSDFSNGRGSKTFSTPKTKTWLQGDLHAYNFGTFNNNDGDLVYGLNDFDEGVIADYQYDIWRMAVSLILIARENGKSAKSDEKKIVLTFAESYLKQLNKLCKSDKEEEVVYTAKKTASPLKDFMQEIDRKNSAQRQKMLEKWTKKGRFNKALEKLGKVGDKERKILIEAIEGKNGGKSRYLKTLNGSLTKKKSKYFKVLDVAERLLAGTGSLGTKRYYVLIEGERSRGGDDIILDIKHQGTASAYPYLNKTDRKLYCFENEAVRTVEAFRALANKTDDHLGWVKLPKIGKDAPAGYYSVRERSPEKDSYPALTCELKKSVKRLTLKKKVNFVSMCRQWGKILATSHARA